MKKKILTIAFIICLLAILFLPMPRGTLKDGGTKEWSSLTYKIIKWNRLTDDGIYENTRVYFGKERFQSIDKLWLKEYESIEHSFIGTVAEVNGNLISVLPVEGEDELKTSDKFQFTLDNIDFTVKAGDIIKVIYKGSITETYPAKINATRCEPSREFRHLNYEENWIDKEKAELHNSTSADIIITEIYKNCFFAKYVIPMPHKIKINGKLPNDFCIGDQLLISYESLYYDSATGRMECDLVSIEKSTFELEPGVAYKPVIYLYPEEKCEISVKLDLNGRLSCTYPEYNRGWNVYAAEDGTLTDSNGQSYNYLYWEGEIYADWSFDEGFCVKGEDTARFLENALSKLGLSRREANEFIIYWLPLMQENPYNIISFQKEAYIDAARLDISPSPDTQIRVFMVFKNSDSFVEIKEQELSSPERSGFVAVEWGGTELR